MKGGEGVYYTPNTPLCPHLFDYIYILLSNYCLKQSNSILRGKNLPDLPKGRKGDQGEG